MTLYRASVDRKLAQLKATIAALSGLLEEPPKVEADDPTAIGDLGISEAIRQVLREGRVAMTPAQVKTRLIEAKFDLNKYANSSAVIHNTLRRLFDQQEVIVVGGDSGAAYALKQPHQDVFGGGLVGIAKAIADINAPLRLSVPSYAEAMGQNISQALEAQESARKAMAKAQEAMKIDSETAKRIEEAKKAAGGFK